MVTFSPERRMLLRGFAAGGALVLLGRPAIAADTDEASRMIAELADRTIAIVSKQDVPRAQRAQELRVVIDRGFDTKAIGRFVLGKAWKTADEAQREQFIAVFRDYTALSYARRFESYAGQKLEVTAARPMSDDENEKVRVLSQMGGTGGPPVNVEWRVRHGSDGWRIYDVVVEGVSMVLTQRSEFAAVIDKNGGKLQPLIDELKGRMAELA